MDSNERIEELITEALKDLNGFCVKNEVKPNSIVVILTHCLLNYAMVLADIRGTERHVGLKKLLDFVEREGSHYMDMPKPETTD